MTPLIVTLALSAALLHAAWNAMAKSSANPLFNIAAYQLVSSLLCVALLPFTDLPTAASWPMLIASVFIHTLYYFSLARAYQSGDLSQVYPLFRGLAPVLVTIAAAIFAGEYLSIGGMIGVGVISLGIMSPSLINLAFPTKEHARLSRPALRWGLITSVCIALYTLVDGLGVRATTTPMSYIFWLFALESIPVVSFLYFTQRREWCAYMRDNPKQIVMGGIANTIAYGLVIFAMSLGAMAIVSSLRETSVIFATLIGTLILKEPFGRQRLLAAGIVVIGIILMRFLG